MCPQPRPMARSVSKPPVGPQLRGSPVRTRTRLARPAARAAVRQPFAALVRGASGRRPGSRQQGHHRRFGHRVVHVPAVAPVGHQPGLAQPRQMLRDRRLALPKMRLEVTNAGLAVAEQDLQDLKPYRVGTRLEQLAGSNIRRPCLASVIHSIFRIHCMLWGPSRQVTFVLGRPDRAPWGRRTQPRNTGACCPPRLPPWRRQDAALALVGVPGHP